MLKKYKLQNTPTNFRGYHFSFAIKQHNFIERKKIILCTAVCEIHSLNNNNKFGGLAYDYNQNI